MSPAPTIGRDEEHAMLLALVGEGRSVVVTGASGVGKTHVAREVMRAVDASGAPTVWAAATRSGRDIPFGALASVLPSEVIAQISGSSTAELYLSIRRELERNPLSLPELICIDDAHLLDDASATLVHQLVTSGRVSMLLVVTSDTRAPEAITALWKEGAAARVELQPLSRQETDDLAVGLLGRACSPIALERIWATTLGNPLYIVELLHSATTSGSLTNVRGRYELAAQHLFAGPLPDVLAARVGQVSRDVRRTLELVALAAPIPIALLERLCGVDTIAEAEEQGLIRMESSAGRTTVTWPHPMFDEVVHQLLPRSRKRSLSRELADAVESTGMHRRDDLLRLLTWRLDGGQTPPTAQLLHGSWLAAEVLDLRLAARLGVAAVAADPSSSSCRLSLADTLYRQTKYAQALAVLDASTPANDRERTEIAIARAKVLWGLGELGRADAEVAASAEIVTDPACLGWMHAFRATLVAASGRPLEAEALARPIAQDASVGTRALLSALGGLSICLAFMGRSADVNEAVARGTDPALLASAESRTLLSWAAQSLWVAAWLSGDIPTAEAMGDSYRRSGLESNDADRLAGGSMAVGWSLLARGQLVTAATRFREAIDVSPETDRIGVTLASLAGVALAHVWSGDPLSAAAALDRAEAAGHDGTRWFAPVIAIGRGWVAATFGDKRGALQLWRSVATDASQRGFMPFALDALHAATRLGDRQLTSRIDTLARRIQGPLAPIIARHAHALHDADAAELLACSASFASIGQTLLAAECAAAAAHRIASTGDHAAAEAARTECDRLLAPCQSVHVVTLDALRTPSVLTGREHEIALLAANGSSARDIAERLFVSVRTVDSHLAHVYTKLGVSGRQGLRAAMGQNP